MKRFIFLSFAFMALGFYELSGGSDFDPVAAREAAVAARSAAPDPPATTTRLAAEGAPETMQRRADNSAADAARATLNLVTFDAATSASDRAPARPAAKRTAVQQPVESPETVTAATAEEIDADPPVLPSLAFAGNSVQAASSAVQLPRDIRSVAGISVNMRAGPGTQHQVVTQLDQDTQVEIIQDTGTGWVQLRPVLGGPTGWVADFLLDRS